MIPTIERDEMFNKYHPMNIKAEIEYFNSEKTRHWTFYHIAKNNSKDPGIGAPFRMTGRLKAKNADGEIVAYAHEEVEEVDVEELLELSRKNIEAYLGKPIETVDKEIAGELWNKLAQEGIHE